MPHRVGDAPIVSSLPSAMKQFSPATKPFCPVEANVPKPRPVTHFVNDAPQRRMSWRSNRLKQGTPMLHPYRLNTSRAAVALGALAIGMLAFSGAAGAAPLQLFPFFMTPPVQ